MQNTEYNSEFRELGAKLKAKREGYGITLDKISATTKIQIRFLEAIEYGNEEKLPAAIYCKLFVRKYCEMIGTKEILEEYEYYFAQIEHDQKKARKKEIEQQQNIVAQQKKAYREVKNKTFYTLISALFLLIIILAIVFHSNIKADSTNPLKGGTAEIVAEKQRVKELEDKLKAEEEARKLIEAKAKEKERLAEQEKKETEQSKAVAQAIDSDEIIITARESTVAIETSFNKQILLSAELTPGQSKKIKITEEPLKITFTPANQANVTFGGKEYKPLHPAMQKKTRYYWKDGTVTFTAQKKSS